MAVYGPGCHPHNIIWIEAQLSPEINTRKRGSPLPVHITLYGPAALTKTNRENKNVKYNI